MSKPILHPVFRSLIFLPTLLFLLGPELPLRAQVPPYNVRATSLGRALPNHAAPLTNLVAPIALYPDPLLGQILVASTYPLELVQAQQWLQQNRYLAGYQLVNAAKQQDWDPSVQLLTAFPDVLALLSGNMQWTSDLGNAFLTRQADVMDAIQSLRAQAYANGRLANTPQFSINTEEENSRSAIEIQPADPQMMYVPSYDLSSVWGPPAEGAYPSLSNQALPDQGNGFGSLFQSVANLAELFPGFPGLLGGKTWGWALSWLAHLLFTNDSFFSNFGFQNAGGSYGGSSVWVHNDGPRFGAANPNGFAAGQYGGGQTFGRSAAPLAGSANGWRTFGSGYAPGSQPARPIVQARWEGGANSQWSSRTANAGNWHGFGNGAQSPSYERFRGSAPGTLNGHRELQPYNRVTANTYSASSAIYRTPYPESRFRPSGSGGFSANNNSGTRPDTRFLARSSQPMNGSFKGSFNGSGGQSYRSSSFRTNFQSSSFSKKPSSRQSAPRPQHFKAAHFSTHSDKRNQAHFSKGHSGGKSKQKGK